MSVKRWMSLLTLALAATVLAIVAGAAGGVEKAGAPAAKSAPAKTIRVGLVTDIGGLNDRGFNSLAFQGVKQGKAKLGAQYRVFTSSSSADYIPNLSTLARQKYDLIIAVGFLMADAVDTVAQKFPQQKFGIIDFSNAGLKHKPKNVRGLLFKEQEAGYLAGYAAGLVVKAKPIGGNNAVSSVGGLKIPPVDRYIAGYQFGAKQSDPGVKISNGYSQDFVAQDKCKEVALQQIAAGSNVVFQVAGGCGLGALDAAKEKGVWGIGVDKDQSFQGPHVLTSALKKVDVAVFKTIQSATSGTFRGGTDTVFDVASGAVGLGKFSPRVSKDIVAKVLAKQKLVAAHKVKGIPTVVK